MKRMGQILRHKHDSMTLKTWRVKGHCIWALNKKKSMSYKHVSFFFFFNFYFFIIHMCIQCLGHFSPLPPPPPLPPTLPPSSPLHPLNTRQKLFCPYL
jgi:hypothetical protein